MQSLVTRKYVRETFNWQIYYWTLTPEGIVYLREYLHLGENVIPSTMKPPKHQQDRPFEERRERRPYGGEGYRRDNNFKKDSDDFRPRYVCNIILLI